MLGRWLATGEVSATADEISTNFLTQVALAEGLAGLLYDTVHEETAPWPDAACTMLRNAVEEDFTRGARQLETARRVQQLLVSRGVRALPLKGAAVAERLYDSVTHRSMLDVDLLVLDDWPRAVTLLKEAGFRPEREADHAQAFVDPALGTVLELHRVITSCGSLFPLDRDGLWMRSRAGVGLVTRVPSTEDLLVQLSLHAAFQHGLRLRLVQFLDFRRLLEREPPDLAVLYRVATDAGAQRAVGVAVEAARVAVGAPIGRDLEELVAEWLPKKLRRAAASTDGTPALPWLRWQLADGRRLQLVRETLSPRCSTPGGERRGRAARALGLARRWAAPALRSFSS
jgi:hypothetical protein